MAVDVSALIAANRAAYERGASPEHPTKVLTKEDLPLSPPRGEHNIPDNVNLIDTSPLQLELDNWLYGSDLHVPLHNREYVRHIMDVGRARKIEDLIIGGDLADFDSLSNHPKLERQAGYKRTKEVLGDLLCLLADQFNLYVLPGNHDQRLIKRIDEVMDFDDVVWASLAGRTPRHNITVTNYDYIFIGPPEMGWVVGHPRFFSTIPAKGGAEVALIQRRNVVGAHNHIIGLMQSRDGRFWAIDPGHLSEARLTPYKMRSDGLSRYPQWRNGFLLVEHNIPRLMTDGLVDWAEFGSR